jgi:hypothetical protein
MLASDDKQIIQSELHELREELRDLKGYQFKLLSLAGAITGFLLSLTRLRLDREITAVPSPLLYLLPLVVILPSWCIFFDKARTITRIVGYCRVIEKQLRHPQKLEPDEFPGWENSLALFRKYRQDIAEEVLAQHKPTFKQRLGHLRATILLIESQRYWVLTYYTFFSLCAVCLSIPLHFINVFHPSAWALEGIFLGVATLLTIVTALFNGVILARLIWGVHSYDRLEDIWKGVFKKHLQLSSKVKKHSAH